MDDIFFIEATKSGIDRNKLNSDIGKVPYITRTDKNNGWDSFVGMQSEYQKDNGNVITVGLDTQTAFYQPLAFYTGQNIQILSHDKMNKHVAMFIIPLLKMQMQKFNWGGNGATLGRLRRQRIKLPADENGNPDFDFMESFMKRKEAEMISLYKQRIQI